MTKEDPHQLKLARLEWELKQRKELADECSLVERENESVAANINKKRGQLDNLAPLLKQLLSVSFYFPLLLPTYVLFISPK